MRTIVVTLALICVAPTLCLAQDRIPVEIEHAGQDSLGLRYFFEIKEAIRGSNSMRLVDSTPLTPRIRVSVITIDRDRDKAGSGQQTTVSTTLVFDSIDMPLSGAFITSYVEYCGSDRINECTRRMLSKIDAASESLRKDSPHFWKSLKAADSTARARAQ